MLDIFPALQDVLHFPNILRLHLQILLTNSPRDRNSDGLDIVRDFNECRMRHERGVDEWF